MEALAALEFLRESTVLKCRNDKASDKSDRGFLEVFVTILLGSGSLGCVCGL